MFKTMTWVVLALLAIAPVIYLFQPTTSTVIVDRYADRIARKSDFSDVKDIVDSLSIDKLNSISPATRCTYLEFAIVHGREDVANLLLDHGVETSIDEENICRSAFITSIYNEEFEIAELILKSGHDICETGDCTWFTPSGNIFSATDEKWQDQNLDRIIANTEGETSGRISRIVIPKELKAEIALQMEMCQHQNKQAAKEPELRIIPSNNEPNSW